MMLMLAFVALTYVHPEQLVDTEWVAAHAADPTVRVVDMRRTGYAEGHAPGAVDLSPDAIRDANGPPTFLPAPAVFEQMMATLGISNATRVIAYDERGGVFAARLWGVLHYFGPAHVALVYGGWSNLPAQRPP